MSELSSKIDQNIEHKQNVGLKRNTIDKFYTTQSAVIKCMNLFKQYITLSKKDLIIEPSAGNGAFINQIKSLKCNYKFYDIEPEHDDIIKQDYLIFDKNTIVSKYKNIHIVGNPPFGRQSSLAIKFIKKSCEFSDSISFILPKSFKKDSMRKSFDLNFHLIHEEDLPEFSFEVNDVKSDVPCIFQIWKKKNEKRDKLVKSEPINFKFVKKIESPDLSFRRVGVNAGNISKSIENKSEQSHYFIKLI